MNKKLFDLLTAFLNDPSCIYEPKNIYDWGFTSQNLVTVFFSTSENLNGFSFIAIGPEYDKQEILFHGWAAFDGVRHLHLGTKGDNNYINYPILDYLIDAMGILKELEKKHCRDYIS